MLAFSGCYYGGGEKERNELGEIRKRWATLPVRLPSFKTFDLDILTVIWMENICCFLLMELGYMNIRRVMYQLFTSIYIYYITIIQSEHPFQLPIEAG